MRISMLRYSCIQYIITFTLFRNTDPQHPLMRAKEPETDGTRRNTDAYRFIRYFVTRSCYTLKSTLLLQLHDGVAIWYLLRVNVANVAPALRALLQDFSRSNAVEYKRFSSYYHISIITLSGLDTNVKST